MLHASRVVAQLPPTIDLAQTSADVVILGANAYDKTGLGFALGDFDGDGNVDFVVASEGQTGWDGNVFLHIFWGCSQLQETVDLAVQPERVSVVRAQPGEIGTYSALTVGDFND